MSLGKDFMDSYDQAYEQGIEDMLMGICSGIAELHSVGNKRRDVWSIVKQWLPYEICKRDKSQKQRFER